MQTCAGASSGADEDVDFERGDDAPPDGDATDEPGGDAWDSLEDMED